MQPIHEYGGQGPLLHLAVANGFPPACYDPLIQPLTAAYRAVSLPPRALWPERDSLPPPESWATLGDDLLAGLRHYDLTDVVAVGHSFGALASVSATIQEPQRFKALVLLDPTILKDDVLALAAQAQAQGFADQMPLAQGALRRRDQFESIEAAFAHWQGRSLFRGWSDEALWAYCRGVLVPDGNGGMALRWPPQWEAHYYATLDTAPWENLRQLKGLLPLLVVQGAETDTFTAQPFAQLQALLPEATFVSMQGQGHLFPLAAPDATRDVILSWLADVL